MMAPVLPWLSVVCVVFTILLGCASSQPEFGVSIHPVFSSSVYIEKNPHSVDDRPEKAKQEEEQSQAGECEFLNTTRSGPGLHEVKTLPRKLFSFFIKPGSSFKRLVFKLNLQSVIHVSKDFYADENLTLNTDDIAPKGGSQWEQVRVEHYQHKRRGLRFDRHAFKISFANITVSRVTHEAWLLRGFQGFAVLAEGSAEILFNCGPEDLNKAPVAVIEMYSKWVMVGFIIVTSVLLSILCCVWVYLKYLCRRKKKPAIVSSVKYPVYDMFDERVLEVVKQKVEALRKGKSVVDPDTVVISYPPHKENFYVLDVTGYGESEGVLHDDHLYEDIDKYYKHTADNMYQNVDDDGHDVSAGDHIYASLSCFGSSVEKRRDETRTSFRY